MDWTFWVGAVVIVALLVVTQVFLHENRWSRRPRPEEPEIDGMPESAEPRAVDGPDDPSGSAGATDDPGTGPRGGG